MLDTEDFQKKELAKRIKRANKANVKWLKSNKFHEEFVELNEARLAYRILTSNGELYISLYETGETKGEFETERMFSAQSEAEQIGEDSSEQLECLVDNFKKKLEKLEEKSNRELRGIEQRIQKVLPSGVTMEKEHAYVSIEDLDGQDVNQIEYDTTLKSNCILYVEKSKKAAKEVYRLMDKALERLGKAF
jgi:hypothetical protein